MKNNLRYTFPLMILLAFTAVIFTGCSKDTAGADINLSYNMLADKTWYLEYTQTTTGTSTSTKTYVGQSTYFINFLKNLTTVDSDGLKGTYTVEKMNNQLQIHVQAKTASGNPIEYVYNVESLGAKNLIMNFTVNSVVTKYYYSTQK